MDNQIKSIVRDQSNADLSKETSELLDKVAEAFAYTQRSPILHSPSEAVELLHLTGGI
ncbi:hypothetical protein GJU39_21795 [Pedobacter petrophilus]|uniref:Uncharacterized protein n=1 Tax=Pedobacter petrophilus TaxID=1908241 RepID=A0A7K0G4I5_9SPHI|nr:hypothetical protein [Pedobacter petrophilus]MRX78713.1 hypothetical protein [Pedobacter petrophilus]